jgi:hypothetical protein
MDDYITACSKCASTNFIVHEAYVWDADIDEESGVLIAHRPSSEIETVACQECAEEYGPSQFAQIEFC